MAVSRCCGVQVTDSLKRTELCAASFRHLVELTASQSKQKQASAYNLNPNIKFLNANFSPIHAAFAYA